MIETLLATVVALGVVGAGFCARIAFSGNGRHHRHEGRHRQGRCGVCNDTRRRWSGASWVLCTCSADP